MLRMYIHQLVAHFAHQVSATGVSLMNARDFPLLPTSRRRMVSSASKSMLLSVKNVSNAPFGRLNVASMTHFSRLALSVCYRLVAKSSR
ncbi:hypothetical protein [Prevotella intermedia]